MSAVAKSGVRIRFDALVTAAEYLVGVALLGVAIASLIAGACALRRFLLPTWSLAPARLAEAVIALTTLVVVSEILGAVHLFSRAALVVALAAIGAGVSVASRRFAPRLLDRSARRAEVRGAVWRTRAWQVGCGTVVVICLMLIPWFYTTLNAIHHGIREFDSLTYHLPFAARFVQDESLTGVQYIGNPPVSFYPMNSELVHAVGILLMRRDLLSVVMNFGWLALGLLGAWCIGRPRDAALTTTASAAFVLSIRLIAFSQGGTAKNDMAALALLLAALGLLANAGATTAGGGGAGRSSQAVGLAALGLAALAGGLAVGTRLNYWAPVLALVLAAVVAEHRLSRPRATATWLGGIVVGGGFWYLRNLAQVSNPFPWIGLKLAGIIDVPSTSGPADCGSTSIAHYVTQPSFLSAHLVPQISPFLGRAWPLLLVVMLVGIGVGLWGQAGSTGRMLAFVALVNLVVYVFTPSTAGGLAGSCFGFNLRFLIPSLMLGILVLPLWLTRRGARPVLIVAAAGCAVLIDARIPLTASPLLAAAAVAVLGCALLAVRWRALSRWQLLAGMAVAGLAVVAAGWGLQRAYFPNRYTQPRLQQPVDAVYAALPRKARVRIAVSGFSESYPLYGVDLSNYVELPAARAGARFHTYGRCQSWIAALAAGRFDYVVTAEEGRHAPAAAAWTRSYPDARRLASSPPHEIRAGKPWTWELFSLPRRAVVDPQGDCGRQAAHGGRRRR